MNFYIMNKSRNRVAFRHPVSDCLKKSALNLNGCTEKSLRVLQSKTQLKTAFAVLRACDKTLHGFSHLTEKDFIVFFRHAV